MMWICRDAFFATQFSDHESKAESQLKQLTKLLSLRPLLAEPEQIFDTTRFRVDRGGATQTLVDFES